MIVSAAIVPHSPLLLPSIGKTHREKLMATVEAYQEIEKTLYISKPESLCIIAPHGARYPDAFSINLAAKYQGNFKSFGDFSTTIDAKSDYLLIDRLQRQLRSDDAPFTLTSNEELDYGFTVPLLFLTPHLQQWKLIPISPSSLNGRAHYEFGTRLQQVLHGESERIAIIASVDLSHKLQADSPGGASTEGPHFDELTRQAVEQKNLDAYLDLASEFTEAAGQCAHGSLAIFFGILKDLNVTPHLLSYEAPFGVGYLTAKYDIA